MNLRKSFENEEQAIAAEQEIEKAIQSSLLPLPPIEIGKNYLVRTITMCDLGKLKIVQSNFIVLSNASWIADTGRFNECLKAPNKFLEVEPFFNDVIINMQNIIDMTLWPYSLPTEPK